LFPRMKNVDKTRLVGSPQGDGGGKKKEELPPLQTKERKNPRRREGGKGRPQPCMLVGKKKKKTANLVFWGANSSRRGKKKTLSAARHQRSEKNSSAPVKEMKETRQKDHRGSTLGTPYKKTGGARIRYPVEEKKKNVPRPWRDEKKKADSGISVDPRGGHGVPSLVGERKKKNLVQGGSIVTVHCPKRKRTLF